MKRWIETIAVLLIGPAVFLMQAAVVSAQPPPEERVSWWGSQAWWSEPGVDPGLTSQHLHVDSDLPVGGTVSGTFKLRLLVTSHHAPANSKLTNTIVYITTDGGNKKGATVSWNHPVGAESENQRYVEVDVNTTVSPYDGWQEFRLNTDVKRGNDGKTLTCTSGFQLYLKNGKTVSNYRSQAPWFNEARGWYTSRGYQNSRYLSMLPINIKRADGWFPILQCTNGSSGNTPTGHHITVDPQQHFHIQGTEVRKADGPMKRQAVEVNLDTIANGWHKLAVLTHEEKPDGTLTGVLMVPFEVK